MVNLMYHQSQEKKAESWDRYKCFVASSVALHVQGIRQWLPLRSPQGQMVGAVQVAARFTRLDDKEVDEAPHARQCFTL